ncbi:hypothetical protein Tco_1087683 [Tanacetum coccineum]
MSSSSTLTYTSVYTDFEPWRFQWVSDEEPKVPEEAPPSPDYVSGPEHPPSPDYLPGPEHPPSPVYVPEPEYLEYLVPSDAKAPVKDQPLPDDASPTALSPGYIVDSDPKEDLEEDPEKDPADGEDKDDDESFDDDDDDDDDDDVEEDKEDEEEEEHLAPVDSSAVPTIDPVPLAEDIEAFETDESAPTPPSPRSRRARISVRLPSPMSASMEACIAKYATTPTLPLPPPSQLTPPSSPLPQIPSPPLPLPSPNTSPTYAEAPLGYRAARIQLRTTLFNFDSMVFSKVLIYPLTVIIQSKLRIDELLKLFVDYPKGCHGSIFLKFIFFKLPLELIYVKEHHTCESLIILSKE